MSKSFGTRISHSQPNLIHKTVLAYNTGVVAISYLNCWRFFTIVTAEVISEDHESTHALLSSLLCIIHHFFTFCSTVDISTRDMRIYLQVQLLPIHVSPRLNQWLDSFDRTLDQCMHMLQQWWSKFSNRCCRTHLNITVFQFREILMINLQIPTPTVIRIHKWLHSQPGKVFRDKHSRVGILPHIISYFFPCQVAWQKALHTWVLLQHEIERGEIRERMKHLFQTLK